MHFTLQSRERDVGDSKCDKATDSSELNVGISL